MKLTFDRAQAERRHAPPPLAVTTGDRRPSPRQPFVSERTTQPRRHSMRKIKSHFFISLDGVVESPDKWHFRYFDDEMGAAVAPASPPPTPCWWAAFPTTEGAGTCPPMAT